MTSSTTRGEEPVIAVGLLDGTDSATIRLRGRFESYDGRSVEPGDIRVECRGGRLLVSGVISMETDALMLTPADFTACLFLVEATIGIDFHWEKKETQAFRGDLRVVPVGDDRLTVINDVPLETYITSVICSEMNADSPIESARAHAVISRSWLLAQLDAREDALARPARPPEHEPDGEIIRWTDREAHAAFDVCADDHCQRYQGIGRMDSPVVEAAIADTRGLVLTFGGRACDARFSKCCGGVTEEFSTAWGDDDIPYLIASSDAEGKPAPPRLSDEPIFRSYLEHPPAAYCNCDDAAILGRVLNEYDLGTEFFRWQVSLEAPRAGELVSKKLGLDLGRMLAMEPVERGPSGRLKRLRLAGEKGSVVIGKELEIRRALSESHLYSSAFVVDTVGPGDRPDVFVLHGAGWGHGVGLCQIGAAAMACEGIGYEDILRHYYPGAVVQRMYG